MLKPGGVPVFSSPEMACTNVAVDWTPNGYWTNHQDGNPVSIGLTLTFTELILAHKLNLKNGVIV